MTKSAWYCPFCNAHHAPHVDTCPNQNASKRRSFDAELIMRRPGKNVLPADCVSNRTLTIELFDALWGTQV